MKHISLKAAVLAAVMLVTVLAVSACSFLAPEDVEEITTQMLDRILIADADGAYALLDGVEREEFDPVFEKWVLLFDGTDGYAIQAISFNIKSGIVGGVTTKQVTYLLTLNGQDGSYTVTSNISSDVPGKLIGFSISVG